MISVDFFVGHIRVPPMEVQHIGADTYRVLRKPSPNNLAISVIVCREAASEMFYGRIPAGRTIIGLADLHAVTIGVLS